MESDGAIACVIYAAKSSEDRRGSIPDQLAQCRRLIEEDAARVVAGTYRDEAFSAFHGNRGPGLAEAMQHAQELAGEHGSAELWALHSDRLARGDGRSGRHAVEIALWALKCDVSVKTLEDPDTFRDLLYAVVTGQRNHEDSRRKGLASAAGRKRAVERGEYIGAKPDGYRRVIEVAESGAIVRRLDVDPARRAVIETIFSMALRGKGTGEIARAVTDAGWLTKPLHKRQQPKPWTIHSVRDVLKNKRYAGLAVHKGEVVGRGNWPAYISERQHERIQTQIARRAPRRGPRQREPYILSRLASCGHCGSPMHCLTGELREDGTLARRYVCASHHWHRHGGRCPQPRIDADALEAMFVSSIRYMLTAGAEGETEALMEPLAGRRFDSVERQRLLQAVHAGDDHQIDAALVELLARSSPAAAMLRRAAGSNRDARELEIARRFEAWASAEPLGRTEASRTEARQLNRLLRKRFSRVSLAMDSRSVVIVTHRREASGAEDARGRAEVRFDRREWMRWSPVARRRRRIYSEWEDAEIIGALQAWADAHGQAPTSKHWARGGSYFPTSGTVRRHFGSWNRGLVRAGLRPSSAETRYRWKDAEIVRVLRRWSAQHGRAPKRSEWKCGNAERPSKMTVCNHFGSWQAALVAAGLGPARH